MSLPVRVTALEELFDLRRDKLQTNFSFRSTLILTLPSLAALLRNAASLGEKCGQTGRQTQSKHPTQRALLAQYLAGTIKHRGECGWSGAGWAP